MNKSFASLKELIDYLLYCPFCSCERKMQAVAFHGDSINFNATISDCKDYLKIENSQFIGTWNYCNNICSVEQV